jgi:hypothetical protein
MPRRSTAADTQGIAEHRKVFSFIQNTPFCPAYHTPPRKYSYNNENLYHGPVVIYFSSWYNPNREESLFPRHKKIKEV